MAIEPQWHKDQIQKFTQEYDVYLTFAEILKKIMIHVCNLYFHNAIVQTRVKSISSFAEKIVRKEKYTDPLNQITDLCGIRIITHTHAQSKQICAYIRDNFLIDEKNSIDVSSRLKVAEFGYLSVHYVISLNKEQILGVKIPEIIRDKKAEIQIRTILQHAWSDICHDRIYKTTINIPGFLKRDSFRLAALLESADMAFGSLTRAIDVFLNNYAVFLPKNKLDKEIQTLKVILENEPDPKSKPQIALKIAKILKVKGQWDEIIQLLRPWLKRKEPPNYYILFEYVNALYHNTKHSPENKEYNIAINHLEQIIKINDNEKSDSILDSEFNPIKAKALVLLGSAYSSSGFRTDKSTEYFLRAYQMDENNPYFLMSYLESEIHSKKNKNIIKPLQHTIQKGIEMCLEHISIGIELPYAYFTMGKFWLLLDNQYKSLDAYTKAIDFCLSDNAYIQIDDIDRELQSLEKLNHPKSKANDYLSVEILLNIAKAIKTGDNRELINRVLNKEVCEQPVLIIAGDADHIDKYQIPKYRDYLSEGLINYKGTIISGGTDSGIPGIVGEVIAFLRKNENQDIKLFGYVPEKLSKSNNQDNRTCYKLIKTHNSKFSPMEPLNNWIDLIAQGINPSDISLLGFGGGPIACFEYQLALSLGAKVGLVENTGRAVSEIIKDPYWSSHANLAILPDDIMTVKAFIQLKTHGNLTNEKIEKAAMKVHEKYCSARKNQIKDPSIAGWNELNEDLKESNRKQVVFIETCLNSIGYGIKESTDPKQNRIPTFTQGELEKMAEIEHGRFNAERLANGWRYELFKDVKRKVSPYLISWKELPDDIKQFDRDAAKEFPKLLKEAGLKIFKLKNYH